MTQTQKRGAAVASLLTSRSRGMERGTDSDWAELNRRIQEGRVIPIISNSLRYDSIFSQLIEQYKQTSQENPCEMHPVKVLAENLLSQVWAQQIGYPLPDTMDLPRVAQFNRLRQKDGAQGGAEYLSRDKDDEQAKVEYLVFLKDSLLAYAENLGVPQKVLDDLYARKNESLFSDLVHMLGYPIFPGADDDPLRVLARLPLPVYVTTDYHDFLERALLLEGKQPVTQLCFWCTDVPNLAPEHVPDPDYKASPERPLVYHLFGLENYPSTMVLTEDDYLDFLVRVTQDVDVNIQRSVIPVNLRSMLTVSSLILLGYRLQDWDFRVLFRGIISGRKSASRGLNLVIQLTPDQQYHVDNVAEARKYLETYFQPKQFNVAWGGVDGFLGKLWTEWMKFVQGSL